MRQNVARQYATFSMRINLDRMATTLTKAHLILQNKMTGFYMRLATKLAKRIFLSALYNENTH